MASKPVIRAATTTEILVETHLRCVAEPKLAMIPSAVKCDRTRSNEYRSMPCYVTVTSGVHGWLLA